VKCGLADGEYLGNNALDEDAGAIVEAASGDENLMKVLIFGLDWDN
jgi:hypothetical protein